MTPINQSIVNEGDGDCFRAAVASVLDLTLEQVPHFIRFGDYWHNSFRIFMRMMGWEYCGTSSTMNGEGLHMDESINENFIVTIPSRSFDGVYHSVVANHKGLVIHDPNPNKRCLGVNIYEEETASWGMFEKVEPWGEL